MTAVEHRLRLDGAALATLVERVLAEDVGRGDVTTALVVPEDAYGRAVIVAREPLVVAGLEAARLCFEQVSAGAVSWDPACRDGDQAPAGAALARLEGPLGPILTAERSALNLLGHTSAVATNAARLSELVGGTAVRLVDTRKTTPGLRVLDKYGVRIGGCFNHRFGLDDGILIKDNHVQAAGGVGVAVRRARQHAPHGLKVEVEIDRLDQLNEAVESGADAVLLDNMSASEVARAVQEVGGKVLLEASGGITEENLRSYAETGVDLISLGGLTHSAPHVDLALEVQ